MAKFSGTKKGEFFKFPGKTKVYVYDGKARQGKKFAYSYYAFDDVNDWHTTYTDREIETGFEF